MSDFDDIFGKIFGSAYSSVVVVTKTNVDSVVRSLNEKYRNQIFDPTQKKVYDEYLSSVKAGGHRVFRDKGGMHKIIIAEVSYED